MDPLGCAEEICRECIYAFHGTDESVSYITIIGEADTTIFNCRDRRP